VPSASLPTIIEALTSDDPRDTVTAAAKPPPPGAIQSAVRSWIDHCYSADRVEDIVDRLRECASSDAHAAADMIATKSPTSLKVTLRALRTARALPTLEACLDMEYQISTTFLDMPDFAEGIRAAVIDKDRRPKWAPDRLDQVSDSIIDRFFGRPGSQLRRAKAATTRGEARARSGFSY
jgi:enoyl-CoA hydratase